MSEKIKVGNAEIEKVNYDYFLLQYSKMSKEYVIADLVSKCEDYEKLYNAYEKLEVEKIQKENIIKEVREHAQLHLKTAKEVIVESEKWLEVEEQTEFAKKDIHTAKVVKRNMKDILEILDKEVN